MAFTIARIELILTINRTIARAYVGSDCEDFITASLLGFVSVFYVVPGLIDLFLYCLKRWGFLESADLKIGDQIRLTTVDGSAIATARSDYSSPGRRI